MAYNEPNWISPYTYEGLQKRLLKTSLNRPRGTPAQHLFLNFRVYRNGKVEHFPSFHYLSTPAAPQGEPTPYVIELRDRHDKVLQAQRVLLNDPHLSMDSASLDVFQAIQWPRDTARIVITRDSCCGPQELCPPLDVSTEAPVVESVSVHGCETGPFSQKVRVVWQVHPPNKSLSYILRYSHDAGQSWRNLTPSIQVTEYEVDLDQLPSGEQCLFQVLATEGIRTGKANSSVFSVRPHRRQTKILMPSNNAVYRLGDQVICLGESYSPDTGSAPAFDLHWHSDRQESLGSGRTLYLRNLQAGVHTITLTVPDGYGGHSSDSVRIEVQTDIVPIPHD